MKTYVVYNRKSNNGHGAKGAFRIKELWPTKELIYKELNEFDTYRELFDSIEKDDEVVICGGDGTLNFLVNDLDCETVDNAIYYYPTGTGNDFWFDLGKTENDPPMIINKYLRKLPTVKVNGMTRKFINGIGYGIDGYCCEVGDSQRAKLAGKPINYTSIAIKGLIYKHKPANAEIIIDGEVRHFKKVWLAPTMKGRYFGGGMMPTPTQDRLDPEGKVSVMVCHDAGKMKALIMFPNIFSGEHLKYKDIIEVYTGKEVTVRFDRPTALQIDGETVRGVTEYSVKA